MVFRHKFPKTKSNYVNIQVVAFEELFLWGNVADKAIICYTQERKAMKKDTAEKRLEACNDVFADIFDNLLFGGNQVIDQNNLHALPTESFSRKMDGGIRQGFRDIVKECGNLGQYHLICGIENQTEIDNTMPERIMGYDYAAYEEQIRNLCRQNQEERTPAYAKRLLDGQKVAPVITVVLYYGTKEAWESPLRLHDMLDFPTEVEAIIKPYVADYTINVIDVSRLTEETRKRLKSDFRLIADYLAYKNKPEQLKQFMNENGHKICHPEEFLDVMSEVASDGRYKRIKEQVLQRVEKKGELTMCIIAEELENKGIELGRIQEAIEAFQECERSWEDTYARIILKFSLSEEEANGYMEKYWCK